jgi:hypothetical protein
MPVLQAAQVTATLESQDGNTVYASADIGEISSAWKHPKIMLKSNGTDASAQLTLYINRAADVSLKMVSLWPAQNVKGEVLQPFRPDLLQYLKDLKPRCCHSLFAFTQLAHSCILIAYYVFPSNCSIELASQSVHGIASHPDQRCKTAMLRAHLSGHRHGKLCCHQRSPGAVP